MKRCPMCKDELDESFFYKHTKTKDGLQPFCKSCHLKIGQKNKRKKGQQYEAVFMGGRGAPESILRVARSRRQNFIVHYGEAVAELIPDGYE